MAEVFFDGKVLLHCGDCMQIIKSQPDCSIDSVVTDAPYALVSITKRLGASNAAPIIDRGSGAFKRAARGFMGKSWDNGDVAFAVEFWDEIFRVIKPGGHVVAFGGTRTYHRLAVAIEDAGFDIRDQLAWCFGSGFPKSHDVALDFETTLCDRIGDRWIYKSDGAEMKRGAWRHPAALEWDGWGTACKPAWEPICLARKPLERDNTVAGNVLQHGTGAINIDGCRIHADDAKGYEYTVARTMPGAGQNKTGERKQNGVSFSGMTKDGRWPANILHDGSPEVVGAFPDAPGQLQDIALDAPSPRTGNVYGKMNRHGEKSADSRYADKGSTNFAALPGMRRGDSGSAARFFYSSKADADDRLGSKHPTVKPVDLMQWLCRLVTPPGGTLLDPFAGTGTTGEAAFREGFKAVLIEREEEYQADIRRRMALMMAGPDERRFESIKAKGTTEDPGPLFR